MSSEVKAKSPLVRIAARHEIPMWKKIIVRASAIVLALIVCAIVIYAIVKMNPLKVYVSMWKGAFGTERKIWITLRDSMVLLCLAIGLAPAFRMKFWNIGAEGQMLVGGIATAACMIYFKNLPTPLLLIVMSIASIVCGAIWGLLPALFKARWGTNETLFTLMMNYVAIQLTAFFVSIWEHPAGSNSVGIINQGTKEGWFPSIFGQQYILNIIIVLVLTVVMFIYLKSTKHGYEIAVTGESIKTAQYIGINVKKVIIRTMCLSGAICGLAGFISVAGIDHTISTTTAGGRGFTAIIVAWLAKFNTYTMIVISILLVFLDKGASQIATEYQLNEYASNIIIGILLFFIIGSEFFLNYRLVFRKKSSELVEVK